jgi:putative nucleotidyltransferase with HDIG domain
MSAALKIPFRAVTPVPKADLTRELTPLADALRSAFGVAFSFWCGESGELLLPTHQQPGLNAPLQGELARGVSGSAAQFVADEDSVLLLAIPFSINPGITAVAMSAFVVRQPASQESLAGPAMLLGIDQARAASWIQRQTIWSSESLLRLASAVQRAIQAEAKVHNLEREVEKLSDNLASTYEEICLLHGVTQNLRISSDDEQLGSLVLNWLLDCTPAQSLAIQLLPVASAGETTYKARTRNTLLSAGKCPLTSDQFNQLVNHLQLTAGCGPVVMNENMTDVPDWPLPQVRQLIIVSLAEGDRVFGWLAAFNHADDGEFGTVEASLLNSVGAMIGIHAGNRDLYRQQQEFLASVVRAMTSAIDAKDPYTCGHSDRVARISVRLAKELGCDAEMLHTLYMAGLLHDIGKIGIDDAVLRKPGKLTSEEFDHIKEHPALGYRILADIQQLANVLPAVLHHHEQWDGKGYPHRLTSENIPRIARIVAVADAYDAMTSDRPYRKGLEPQTVDQIFREGAGKQWDPEVIAAFFASQQDVLEICAEERANLTLDVGQWV